MKIRCGLFLATWLSCPVAAHAGAWLQADGQGQSITTLRFYETDQYINKDGDRQTILPFTKTELASYFEYGVTPKLTFGGEINLAGVTNGKSMNTGFDSSGISYGDIFARAFLYKSDDFVISIQPGVNVPSEVSADLSSDGGKPIPELKLDFGYGFDNRWQHHFIDASVLYRNRNAGDLKDMVKYDVTLGYALTDQYMIYLEGSREETLGSVDNVNGNYNLTKPQVSFLYNPDERFSHQVGAFANVEGRNIGAGYGLFYSFWYNF